MEIDWSKAPEGFPLWLEGTNEDHRRHSGWHRERGLIYESPDGGQWRGYREGQFFTVHRKPAQDPWDGEGLPPVGTFVVVHDNGTLVYGQGESGEVLAHVEGCAVIRMSYGLGCFTPEFLRTPEQMEQEEQQDYWLADVALKYDQATADKCAEILVNAGYRKQVKS